MSEGFHAALRAATAADHAAVDSAYGGFDLTDPDDYASFLTAHARALPAIETALVTAGEIGFRPRAHLLAQDLAALDLDMPAPLPIAPPTSPAARAGMLYVIEGSRLGGGLLARQVPANLPSAYLSATHLSGEWRALLARLDGEADAAAWRAEAAESARATFALYQQAAATA